MGEIPNGVKIVLDEIIKQRNYKLPPEINVARGSQDGDGYVSKTYAITIKEADGNTINLFVKYLPEEILENLKDVLTKAFQIEYRFYNDIHPIFSRFQKSRNVREPFDNVSKHYQTNKIDSKAPPIFLEDLRILGYALRDRKAPIDDHHIKLPVKALAKYHAISYALKDQKPELYRKVSYCYGDIFCDNYEKFGMPEVIKSSVQQLVESLDSVTHKKILDGCQNLDEKIISYIKNVPNTVDEYAVLTQGDCWSNNMMFLYDAKTGLPIDVKLIDWQAQRTNSPLLDFSYFFYTLATKSFLENANDYLNLYYTTLCQHIKDLGSDPRKLFPREIFEKHWKQYAMYGLCLAFVIVKVLLFEKNEIPDLGEESFGHLLARPIKQQDKYLSTMKNLVEYFIDNDLIRSS